jgi:multidrug resistance efflux pump
MNWQNKRSLPLAILAVAVTLFILLIVTRPKQAPLEPKERIWYVETITVEPQSLSPTLTLYGQVETPDLVKASAPKDGQVHQVLVREGALIRRGQLLLTLDSRDFELATIQKEAQVEELEAMIESEELRHANDQRAVKHEQSLVNLSESAVTRAKKLIIKNLVSKAALDQAYQDLKRQVLTLDERKLSLNDHYARLKQLEARHRKAQAELATTRIDLERSRIHAPFDGFVSEINVASGERVNTNLTLLVMYPSNTLEVRALIPTPYQAELQQALARGIRLQTRALYADTVITLELDRFSAEASSKGLDALFLITESSALLRLGNNLVLSLSRPAHANSVAIPQTALYGHDKIYRLDGGRMQRIHVTNLGDFVQPSGSTLLVISSPILSKGDRIVTTHLPNAVNGLRVEARNVDGLTSSKNPMANTQQPAH